MGDTGEPCGIPVWILVACAVNSGRAIVVVRLLRKEAIHCTVFGSILLFRRLCTSLRWDTLSNAPDTSSSSRLATCLNRLMRNVLLRN